MDYLSKAGHLVSLDSEWYEQNAWEILYGQFSEEEIDTENDRLMKTSYWKQFAEMYESESGSHTKYYENLDTRQL